MAEAARIAASRWACDELERVQAELANGFTLAELTAESQPVPAGAELSEQLAPYLAHFAQQQRVVASSVSAFRANLRARLVSASGRLARLAQLDQYIERALASPEQRSMKGLSTVLNMRAQKHHAVDASRWRSRLESDLQRLLHAELDQRLQPVLGLMEALNTNSPT